MMLKKLNLKEKIKLADEIRVYISNSMGNLIETYRYESVDEGEEYEEYLDRLLMLADSIHKPYTTIPEYQEYYQQSRVFCVSENGGNLNVGNNK